MISSAVEERNMAVARIEQGYARRYSPPVARHIPLQRPAFPARRAIVVGLVAAGAILQHAIVSLPLEPQPVRPVVSSLVGAPLSAATPAAPAPAPAPAVAAANTRDVIARPATGGAARHATVAVATGTTAALEKLVPRPASGSATGVALPPVGAFGDAHRVAMAANPEGAIMHAPSVSVAAIRAALRTAGSPVLDATYADHKDAAEYIWDSGRVVGVDPAVVMGMFHHESLFGTRGMARQTLSVGNIRPLAGQPQINGYRLYASWQQGIDDCYRLLRSYVRNGVATVSQAIPVWAPPSDNNDDSAYIASVLGAMGALNAASATK